MKEEDRLCNLFCPKCGVEASSKCPSQRNVFILSSKQLKRQLKCVHVWWTKPARRCEFGHIHNGDSPPA